MGETSEHILRHANWGASVLLRGMKELRASNQLQDVALVCEGGAVLQAHSTVLASASRYFRTLLAAHWSCEQRVVVALPQTPVDLLGPLLDWMYNGEASVDKQKLGPFLELASALHVSSLEGHHTSQRIHQDGGTGAPNLWSSDQDPLGGPVGSESTSNLPLESTWGPLEVSWVQAMGEHHPDVLVKQEMIELEQEDDPGWGLDGDSSPETPLPPSSATPKKSRPSHRASPGKAQRQGTKKAKTKPRQDRKEATHSSAESTKKRKALPKIQARRPPERLTCDPCGKTYKYRNDLHKHVVQTHLSQSKRNHVCAQCGKSYSWSKHLRRHEHNVHGKDSHPRPCPVCNKMHKNAENLAKHMYRYHPLP